MNNDLQLIINKLGLAPEQAKPLLDSFGDFFVKAHKLTAQSKAIKVTREDQVGEMKQAREYRIQLKNLRNEADKARSILKEGYLRGGNAVQSIYNDIRDIIEPEEDRLREQEKFAEILKEKRLAERFQARTEQLSKYTEKLYIYNFKDIDDEGFNFLLENVKMQYENGLREEKKLEEERIAREKIEIEKQKKIQLENEKLREQAKEREEKLAEERRRVAVERAKQEEILRKEREAKAKLEAEIRVKKEAEEKARQEELDRIAKVKAEAEEVERQKQLAPDKTKLLELAKQFEQIAMPDVQSDEAKKTIQDVVGMIGRLSVFIKKRANEL